MDFLKIEAWFACSRKASMGYDYRLEYGFIVSKKPYKSVAWNFFIQTNGFFSSLGQMVPQILMYE
jgi:hypothetical protein